MPYLWRLRMPNRVLAGILGSQKLLIANQALDQWRQRLSAEIYYYKYIQFEFFRQWSS